MGLAFFVSNKDASTRTYFWHLSFFSCLFFSGFRHEIGTDFNSYENIFNNLSIDYVGFFEYGNYLLMLLTKSIGAPFQFYIFITSSIICYSFFKFIRVFSIDKSFSIMIFVFFGLFFLSSLNFIRQFLSISFFLLALCCLETNNKKSALALFFVSITFHTSAILTVPVYMFYKKKIKLNHIILGTSLFVISIYLSTQALMYTNYGIYIERATMLNKSSPPIILILLLISISSVFIVFLLKKSHSHKNSIFLILLTLSISNLVAAIFIEKLPYNVFLRANNFFMPSYIIILPLWVAHFKNLHFKVFLKSATIVLLLLYFARTTIILGEKFNLFPYKSFLHV